MQNTSLHSTRHLSEEFTAIERLCDQKPLNLQLIFIQVKGRGEALFTLFLAGPFIFPIPLPGLSIPFGILIVILGFAMATGYPLYLPKGWMSKPLPEGLVRRFCQLAKKILFKMEKWLKPRWTGLSRSFALKRISAGMIASCGLMLALPLPPGTNAPPALAIVFLSLAILEDDGLMLLIGYGLFLLNILFFTLLSMLGYEAIIMIIQNLL